ncbi:putative EGF-like domain-containing protein [Helianthus anomalus]
MCLCHMRFKGPLCLGVCLDCDHDIFPFLGKPSLPEMVITICLSLTALMKWFRAIWSATSPISRHSLLYRTTNASRDSSSLRQIFITSNESRSDPTGKESNQALARPVRVWGKKLHQVGSSHWPLHPAPMKLFMWSFGSDEPLYFPTLNENFVVVTWAWAIRGANLEFSAAAFGL